MKMLVCSVRDVKANAYQSLVLFSTPQLAERAMGEAILQGKNNIAKYPHDHAMYCLGTYDDETGVLSPAPVPELIATGSQFVKIDTVV